MKHDDIKQKLQQSNQTASEKAETDFEDISEQNSFFESQGETQGILEHPSYKALEEQLSAAEAKMHENWDKAVRSMAELDNFRRRVERDLDGARKFAIQRLIEELLPVIDSLEQALQVQTASSAEEVLQSMRHGIELTLKLFHEALKKFEVQAIDPAGEAFDARFHEVVSTQQSDKDDGTILVVLQKGYLLHDRAIRPARVIIAKNS